MVGRRMRPPAPDTLLQARTEVVAPSSPPHNARVDLATLCERLEDALAPRDEILEAYLFGSWARGQAQRHSDVDVAVFVEPALVKPGAWGYQAELGTALMAAVGKSEVDVVVLNRAPPLLYHRVLHDGVRLLARDLRQTTVREGQALSRYLDWLPQLKKFEQAYRRRIEAGDFGR